MVKPIFGIMKQEAAAAINAARLELLGLEEKEKKNEDGTVTKCVQVTCEVAKKSGVYSRCQFSVKIEGARMKLKPEQLDETDYIVIFDDLEISYIDTKGNVYFRASNYDVDAEVEL